jgi:hypothetical protein
MKLVATCNNGEIGEMDEIVGVTDLIAAAKSIDFNNGSDSLNPEYELIDHDELLNDPRQHGYFFYTVPDDFDIESGNHPIDAGSYVGAVKATYQL